MAGKLIKRTKIQGLANLTTSLFADFKECGLTQVTPATGQNFTPTAGAGKFVMDSSATVNPLHATQPWRMVVEVTGASAGQGYIRVAIANPQQIDNSGVVSSYPGAPDPNGLRVMGQLGKAYNTPQSALKNGDVFINRNQVGYTYDNGTTISYIMTATTRGIGLFVWEEGSDDKPKFSWFFIQSPVDKDTGEALLTDNSPIFCVFSCDNTSPMKYIVSESDVFRPSAQKPADTDSVNSSAILNSFEQVAIAKGNKYLITFPNRLNTDRYAYTEELDLFAYTSADVIADESEIPITVYGEATPRIYRAMKSNGENNTGMRIMMLVSGGGIDAAV